jgi:predicted  nucleic acid-binding Zn-ribbon protein
MINAMRYSIYLEESGFSKDQATTMIKVLSEIMNDNFATSQDIQIAKLETKADMESFRSEVRDEFVNVRSEMKEGFANVDKRFLKVDQEFLKVRSDIKALENRMTVKLSSIMVGTVVLIQVLNKII